MARTKKFNSMSLLEQVEYLVKKQLPKEATLVQKSLNITYSLTVNINTEDNPFQLTSKTYEVIVEYYIDEMDSINVAIKDEGKLIKDYTINLKKNGVNLNELAD